MVARALGSCCVSMIYSIGSLRLQRLVRVRKCERGVGGHTGAQCVLVVRARLSGHWWRGAFTRSVASHARACANAARRCACIRAHASGRAQTQDGVAHSSARHSASRARAFANAGWRYAFTILAFCVARPGVRKGWAASPVHVMSTQSK